MHNQRVNYKFSNFPNKTSIEEYYLIDEKVLDFLNKFNFIISVYKLGNLNHPGISDIDLLIIVDEKKTEDNFINFVKKETKKISHLTDISIMQESVFKKINCYAFASNLKYLSGKEYQIQNNGNNITKDITIIICASIKRTQFIRKTLLSGNVDVRKTLLNLNSIIYTINLLHKLSNKNHNELLEFSSLVNFHRDDWFNKSKNRQEDVTLELVKKSLTILNFIITKTSNLITDDNLKKIYLNLSSDTLVIFGQKIRVTLTNIDMFLFKIFKLNIIYLPINIIYFLYNHSYKTNFQKYILDRILKGKSHLLIQQQKIVHKHFILSDQHLSFLLRNSNTSGGAFSIASLYNNLPTNLKGNLKIKIMKLFVLFNGFFN